MNFTDEQLDVYLKRFHKIRSNAELKKETMNRHRRLLKKLIESNIMEKALSPQELYQSLKDKNETKANMTNTFSALTKLLINLTDDELRMHWPNHDDWSFQTLISIIDTYKNFYLTTYRERQNNCTISK